MPGLPERIDRSAIDKLKFRVTDAKTRAPIANATVFVIGNKMTRADTDISGHSYVPIAEHNMTHFIAAPREGYWSRLVTVNEATSNSDGAIEISLRPLSDSDPLAWGHRLMGFPLVYSKFTGKGIRIGVIDSGIANQHRRLRPRGGLNTLDGEDPDVWWNDIKGHGSHCAGIMNAMKGDFSIQGGAPDAEVFAVRVLPGGFVSDLAEAVDWCVEHRMDIISMSLGGPKSSVALAQSIDRAMQKGITVFAASGNSAAPIFFPASMPAVVSVGAIGRFGTFPSDSAHIRQVGQFTDHTGKLFSASFSNTGEGLTCCGPGVAVASTVPNGFACWDGTSMACPMVAAAAALALEANPRLRTGDNRQPARMKELITASCADLGMPVEVQGNGLPLVPKLIELATLF